MPSLNINGDTHALSIPSDTPLLWALRDHLGLKGTKYGCGVGVCGLCLVHVDGDPVRSCITPLADLQGKQITTIEGLAPRHPLIRAWIEEQVPQCGYCQPAQVMMAAALLDKTPSPDEERINEAMSVVLCRCGSYPRIQRALQRALKRPQANDAEPSTTQAGPTVARQWNQKPPFAPNPWVRIYRDARVEIIVDRAEMGQGVLTGLAMLVAEELEVQLSQVQTVFAPAHEDYVNPLIGEQLTGGSTSIRAGWKSLRRAGAEARETLIKAASLIWGVAVRDCTARNGGVIHNPSEKRLEYGDLVDKARTLDLPTEIPLKTPDQFRLMGRSTPRLEIPDMVRGKTVYGIDAGPSGHLVATVERCPFIGGELREYNARTALAVPGVKEVLRIPSGIAVVAENTHAAFEGRRALKIDWLRGRGKELDSASIRNAFIQAVKGQGKPVRNHGHGEESLHRASQVLEAVYETPYLAHGCLEPMNCYADVTTNGCEIWTGTQAQTAAQRKASKILGIDPARIKVHTQFIGGGFGRRGDSDFVAEAVRISKAVGTPVQLLWSREDDIRHDRFRPASHTLLQAGLDDSGMPTTWLQRIVGPDLVFNGIHVPYAIPNQREEHKVLDPGVPTSAWRAVGASQNAFAIEGFVDELAHAAGADPFEYRYRLLTDQPGFRRVLETAADKGGWHQPPAQGRQRGIAFYHSFHTAVAQVAEVSVSANDEIKVHRVVCAVDCGLAVNPDAVVAQLEGGIIFGLTAALKSEITIKASQVQQSNFQDYPIITFSESPQIEVHIIPSTDPPRGVGEPGVPPIAPAVANAVFAATGHRLRSLPLRLNS